MRLAVTAAMGREEEFDGDRGPIINGQIGTVRIIIIKK